MYNQYWEFHFVGTKISWPQITVARLNVLSWIEGIGFMHISLQVNEGNQYVQHFLCCAFEIPMWTTRGSVQEICQWVWHHLVFVSLEFILSLMERWGFLRFYQHRLTFIPIGIINHRPRKNWDGITYLFLNVNGVLVWKWMHYSITHFIMDVIIYSCWNKGVQVLNDWPPWCNHSTSK